MIIKATRLQAWAPGGGKSRPSPPCPLEIRKKVFWLHWGPFCYFFLMWESFCYVFLILGGIFIMWYPFCYFSLHGGGLFFGLAPRPSPTKISAGAHDCKEGSRAFSPEILLCDRNLVSCGHVLLRFCLKNDKNNDKL